MTNKITIQDLTFTYADSLDGFRLGPVNLSLERGRVYGWQGHNGSGKSTLASILAGSRKHSGGKIFGLPANVLYFQQNISANIFPDITVEEHFRLGGNGSRSQLILRLFPSLREHFKNYPDALSGGQLQRLAFSLALTRDFDLYLFDEVTNHLDAGTSRIVGETMRGIVRDQPETTVVFVSHDKQFLDAYADRIFSFEEGQIVTNTVE